MPNSAYDIAIVGGGLAGSALAKAMADRGASVVVLERETRMKDRVRGELMWPWGASELVKLGLYTTLISTVGHQLPWLDVYRASTKSVHRDLPTTTTPALSAISFYHADMQEVFLQEAASAGAQVFRGARVRGVDGGATPTVAFSLEGKGSEIRSRLVVGADGRTSAVRGWGGFQVQRDPDQTLIAGALFEDMPAPDDASHIFPYPKFGMAVLLFPLGLGRVRSYFCYPAERGYRLSGRRSVRRFIEESLKTGVPAEYYSSARIGGPLATFSGAHSWVDHPYRQGVALIGDAAAASDPTHGQGLSKAVRDARVLRDRLLANEDWDEAGHAYAEEHDIYYGINHTFEAWVTRLLFATGPEADALRATALPTWPAGSTTRLEPLYSGPNSPLDDDARRRFWGEA